MTALRHIRDTSITSEKKTPYHEVDEMANSLDAIYKNLPSSLRHFRKMATKYGYADMIPENPVNLDLFTWAAGDGDGNPKMDAHVLKYATETFQKRIRSNYATDLTAMSEKYGNILTDDALDFLQEASQRLQSDDINQFTADHMQQLHVGLNEIEIGLLSYSESIKELMPFRKDREDFLDRANSFKLHYTRIDIRHNALDFITTITHVAKSAGLLDQNSNPSAEELEPLLSQWLNDESAVRKMQHVSPLEMESATAQRIWGRLFEAATKPEMFKDLIIAETDHPAHALAAMLAAKATGNTLNIVTLTESAIDLQNLGNVLDTLADNTDYLTHVQENQGNKITVMIAKSDTVRQDGMGATHDQVEAISDAVITMHKRGIQVEVFSGGGAALVRGGGRPDEIPFAVADAIQRKLLAMDEKDQAKFTKNGEYGAVDLLPVKTTIQGHQVDLLMGGGSHFLTQYASQNLSAHLKLAGILSFRELPNDLDRTQATKAIASFSTAAKQGFRDLMFNGAGGLLARETDKNNETPFPGSIDKLMEKGASLTVTLGNLASRAIARGVDSGSLEGWTYNELHEKIISKKPASQQRAITNDKTAIHSGTAHTGYLGAKEGLESMVDKHGKDALHHAYRADKNFRDTIRNVAMSLHIADFDQMRELLGAKTDGNKQDYQTIDLLEQYTNDTAALVYQTVFNKPAPEDLTRETVTQEKWPDIADLMHQRDHREVKFGRKLEAWINRTASEENKTLDAELIKLGRNAYASTDTTNAPFLINELTRDLNKSREKSDDVLINSLKGSGALNQAHEQLIGKSRAN